MKEAGVEWKPLWFDFEIEGNEVKYYRFNNKYFECRRSGEWPSEILPLFDN